MTGILFIITVGLVLWRGLVGFRHGFVKELVGFLGIVIWVVQLLLLVITVESFRHNDLISGTVAVVILLVFGLFHKGIKLISIPAKIASHIPVIHLLNKLAGIAVGVLEACSFLWVFFCYTDAFGGEAVQTWIAGQLQGNDWLTWLKNHNYLVDTIRYCMRSISGYIAGLIKGL